MLYFGETFSRTRVAFRLDAVACERCGKRYAYPLLRHGVGSPAPAILLEQLARSLLTFSPLPL